MAGKSEGVSIGLGRKIDTWAGLAICAALYLFARARGERLPFHRATTPPDAARPPAVPRRILTIKTYGLGNMCILMPVLAALRRAYPDATIDMLTLDSNCRLMERSGLIDHAIPFRLGSVGTVVANLWGIIRTTRERKYDLVIDFEQFIKMSSIIAYLSGAPERIGFNTDAQRRAWLYTIRVVYTDSEHQSKIFARLLRPMGIVSPLVPFEFPAREEEEAAADRLLAEFGIEAGPPLIAVHAGSGTNYSDVPLKRWPVEYFAALCDQLVSRHGAVIVFTGKGDEERQLIERTMGLMKGRAVSACDRLGIGELLGFLRRCTLAVSNDTSVMHLAALVGTPVVALFGATSPLQYGPQDPEKHLVMYQDLYCSPCVTNYNLKVSNCSDAVCMRGMTVDHVLEAMERKFLNDATVRASLSASGVARRLHAARQPAK
jgi:lipopolysaccharide heptosyltransferase II